MTIAEAPPTTEPRTPPLLRSALVVALIYFFLVGVSSLETGIKIMGADTQERLFSTVSNPLAGLFIGILGTILVQSSSASTSVIVGLVAARALKIDDAVPMIMGANIGTTVTNTLVSLAHIRQSEEFKRAFSVATVHDFFNVIAVAVLLPIELATGVLSSIAEWISSQLLGNAGTEWKSPIKQYRHRTRRLDPGSLGGGGDQQQRPWVAGGRLWPCDCAPGAGVDYPQHAPAGR